MASRNIVISVSSTGTVTVTKQIASIGDAASKSHGSVVTLRGALSLLGSAATIKGFVEMADTMTTIRNRLGFVSKSTDEAAVVQEKLLEVANRSRSSFESTVELYSRVALSTTNLKLSHQDLTRVVETMNKAVILSGANQREAEAAIIQFSQGLAQGALRGQEMRSVMEQIPYVADIIAQKMGVTRGALRELGSQGQVSAQIMVQALLEASGKVDGAFGKTFPTVEQQVAVLKNQLLKFIDDLNQKFQIMPRLAKLISFLSDNFETFGRIVLAGIFVVGVTAAISALSALTAAIALNPFGAIAIAITGCIALLITFSDQIKFAAEGQANLSDFAMAAWDEFKSGLSELVDEFAKDFGFIGDLLKDIFGGEFSFTVKGFLTLVMRLRDGFVGTIKGMLDAAVVAFKNFPAVIELVFKTVINKIIDGVEAAINALIDGINYVGQSEAFKKLGIDFQVGQLKLKKYELSSDAKDVGAAMGKAFTDAFNNETAGVDMINRISVKAEINAQERLKREAAAAANRAKGAREFGAVNAPDTSLKDQKALALDEYIKKLQEEAEVLQYVGRERTAYAELIKFEQTLRKKGITLNEEEKRGILDELNQNQVLKQRAAIIDEVDGKLEENARAQEIVNQLIKDGTGNTELYIDKLRKLKMDALAQNKDVASGFQRGFLSVQDEVTNFAKISEQTVTNAFSNMEDAFVSFVKTGKLSFSSLVDGMLADLTRLLFRQALVGLVGSLGGGWGAIFGAAAGAAGGGSMPARATGGPVSRGKAYMVGENGPEVFSPSSSGAIIPNGAMSGGGQTPVNVSVVNVTDPKEIQSALNDPKNHEIIINVARRNKNAFKQALGI